MPNLARRRPSGQRGANVLGELRGIGKQFLELNGEFHHLFFPHHVRFPGRYPVGLGEQQHVGRHLEQQAIPGDGHPTLLDHLPLQQLELFLGPECENEITVQLQQAGNHLAPMVGGLRPSQEIDLFPLFLVAPRQPIELALVKLQIAAAALVFVAGAVDHDNPRALCHAMPDGFEVVERAERWGEIEVLKLEMVGIVESSPRLRIDDVDFAANDALNAGREAEGGIGLAAAARTHQANEERHPGADAGLGRKFSGH